MAVAGSYRITMKANDREHTLVFVVEEWSKTMCDGRHQ